jgi:hypothetical protein
MNGRATVQGLSLQSIIAALPLSIFWKNRDSRYLGSSDSFARAFGTHNVRRESALCGEEFEVLMVSDTGGGMSEEATFNLFEPFFAVKSPGVDTGLGLAAVYGTANQSQGQIEVSGEPDRGTEFRLHFSCAPGNVSNKRSEHGSAELPLRRATILLVEDEEAVRSLALRGLGYGVLEVAARSASVAVVEQRGGSKGLLLTDIVMPGMRGSEQANHIISPVPLGFMSGYPDNDGWGWITEVPRVHFLRQAFYSASPCAQSAGDN